MSVDSISCCGVRTKSDFKLDLNIMLWREDLNKFHGFAFNLQGILLLRILDSIATKFPGSEYHVKISYLYAPYVYGHPINLGSAFSLR